MSTVVRLATLEDEPGIINLCRLMHVEQGVHPLKMEKVFPIIRRGTARQGGIIGVIGPSHDIQAGILLILDPIWYSDDFQLLELFSFVREDSRRSDYAKSLLMFAKHTSDQLQIDLTIGIFSNIRTEAKCRLYERQFTKAGYFFSHSPKKIEASDANAA
jgi:hypothetical protein